MSKRYIAVNGSYWQVKSNYVAVGGIWRRVKAKWIAHGGVWRKIYAEGLSSVTVSVTSVHGLCKGSGSCTAYTNGVTATPHGGTGHSYQWQKVSGATFNVGSLNAASTGFSAHAPTNGSVSAVYRCRVTDSNGTVKYSPNVNVLTAHEAGGGFTP